MAAGTADNPYISYFQQALTSHDPSGSPGSAQDFADQLVAKIEARLQAEGLPQKTIDTQVTLAEIAAGRALSDLARRPQQQRATPQQARQSPLRTPNAANRATAKTAPQTRAKPVANQGARQSRDADDIPVLRSPALQNRRPRPSPAERGRGRRRRPARRAPLWLRMLLLLLILGGYGGTAYWFFTLPPATPMTAPQNTPPVVLALDLVDPDFAGRQASLQITPVGGSLMGRDGSLSEDLTVIVEGGDRGLEQIFRAGTPISPMRFSIELIGGDVRTYPLDRYGAAWTIEAAVEGSKVATRLVVRDAPADLRVTLQQGVNDPHLPREQLSIARAPTSLIWIGVLVGSLGLVCLCVLLVSWFAMMHGRMIDISLMIWNATLLVAIPVLRSILPGTPPLGIAMDVLLFAWLQGLAGLSLLGLGVVWIGRGMGRR